MKAFTRDSGWRVERGQIGLSSANRFGPESIVRPSAGAHALALRSLTDWQIELPGLVLLSMVDSVHLKSLLVLEVL